MSDMAMSPAIIPTIPTVSTTPVKPDPADAHPKDGVMLALLPITTDWCKMPLPHMTLVYAGTVQDLQPSDFNELSKDASMLAALTIPLNLKVMGIKQMGDQVKVDALCIQPSTELWAMRRAVEQWNASQFPFTPHATIGPAGTGVDVMPRMLSFDRLYVGWGEECLTFRLNGPRF